MATSSRCSVSMAAASLIVAVVLLAAVNVNATHVYVNSTLLPKTILIHALINGANITNSSVLRHGKDNLTVVWSLNSTAVTDTSMYKQVMIKLCYGQISAINRSWRKNSADLTISKTCPHVIARQPFSPTGNRTVYRPPNDTPEAYYFVRAFVLNTTDHTALPGTSAIAIGSSTNVNRTTNLFKYDAYTGRSTGIYIAIALFSVASYVCLLGFFFVERLMKKRV